LPEALELSTQTFVMGGPCCSLDFTNKELRNGLDTPVSDALEANIGNPMLQISGTISPQDGVETFDNVMSLHFFFR